MPGSTFSAEQRHGPLRIGQIIDGGWSLVKRTPIGEGDVMTFTQHRPQENRNTNPRHRRAIQNLQRSREGVTI
jgi:hypothetical protein